jgi:hypothetical protein
MGTVIFLLAVIGAVVYLLVTAYVAKTQAEKSAIKWHMECMQDSFDAGRRWEREQMKRERDNNEI